MLSPAGWKSVAAFTPTFSSSRYERTWILTYLGPFYEDKKLTDVLRRVKGGKEANVYCCQAHPDTGLTLLAAKVYRPRMLRNLRNDARYRQGRDVLTARGKPIRDRRTLAAIRGGTRIGKEMVHTSWLAHEFDALQRLHAAGIHVPRPLAMGNNTILMEYLGDVDRPAPTLNSLRLPAAEARRLYKLLLEDVEGMLANNIVHADLSAYNVLYGRRTPRADRLPAGHRPGNAPGGL